jgi:amicyanin
MLHLSNGTRVTAILVALLCAVPVVGWIVYSSSAGAGVASTADSGRGDPAAQTSPKAEKAAKQVVVDNFKFEPRELTIAAGTKVTWINRDDVPHTATSTARPKAFDSKTLDTDQQFSHVFTTPGTYEYFCAVHPHMKGKIVVK